MLQLSLPCCLWPGGRHVRLVFVPRRQLVRGRLEWRRPTPRPRTDEAGWRRLLPGRLHQRLLQRARRHHLLRRRQVSAARVSRRSAGPSHSTPSGCGMSGGSAEKTTSECQNGMLSARVMKVVRCLEAITVALSLGKRWVGNTVRLWSPS